MIDAAVRILHVMAVVVWIGHNWSNVVQTPFYRPALPADPDDAVREVAIAASKREHGIFRYASLIVLTTGLFMLWRRGDVVDALTLTGPSAILGAGIWVAIIMLLNLWGVLWPHQKKVLGFVQATRDERLACTRITFLSSRINTVLATAAIVLMIAGAHAAV
ncbi:MAG: hypothetical protein H6876_01170 [Hyphomicrobiaceae bacterium]|nr:hypothetical protein [Hyphomicrobiaceae bacterium]